ncbi:MAG TPA: PEP-CTERM sorting domain-containing protein [Alphaproteobacteria bacterium]|nr:PEP-CTERM sorting domain-containing protein [Alphaproteobacteria bacterium]
MTGGPIIPFRNPQGYGQPKSNINAAGSSQYIISNTGSYYGASGQFNIDGKKYTAAGAANTMPFGIGPAGTAAGSAYDPYSVTPGNVYGYSPQIDVHLDPAAGETGGVHVFAVDTNSASDIDSFDQDGEPVSEDLWTLDVTEDKSGNPVVDFEMNPANPADSEIQFALPYLQSVDPTDCLSDSNCEADNTLKVDNAIDESEDAAIEAAFLDNAGDDVLNNFSLFGTYDNNGVITDDATYTPACVIDGCTIEYGDGVDAGLDVPEPGTLTLLGAALAGLATVRGRAFRVLRR